jgi:hypothetical protein
MGPMRLSTAVVQVYESVFERALGDPTRLVALHRRIQQGRGRRSEELTSLNRAVIVVSIAAWQAYIEALVRAIIDFLGPPADLTTPGTTLKVVWEGRRTEVEEMLQRYSTANSANTLKILRAVNFDPEPAWGWGAGRGRLTPGQVKNRLDLWVKVRHTIAHGSSLPPSAKRLLTENKSGLTVRLKDAESCLNFIRRLAAATDEQAREMARRIDAADSRVAMDEARFQMSQASIASLLRSKL